MHSVLQKFMQIQNPGGFSYSRLNNLVGYGLYRPKLQVGGSAKGSPGPGLGPGPGSAGPDPVAYVYLYEHIGSVVYAAPCLHNVPSLVDKFTLWLSTRPFYVDKLALHFCCLLF